MVVAVLLIFYVVTVVWLVRQVNYWYDECQDLSRQLNASEDRGDRLRVKELETLSQVSLGNLKLTKIKGILEG